MQNWSNFYIFSNLMTWWPTSRWHVDFSLRYHCPCAKRFTQDSGVSSSLAGHKAVARQVNHLPTGMFLIQIMFRCSAGYVVFVGLLQILLISTAILIIYTRQSVQLRELHQRKKLRDLMRQKKKLHKDRKKSSAGSDKSETSLKQKPKN